MRFIVQKGPFIKAKDHTTKIMMRLLLALTPIIIFAFYKNGLAPFFANKISFIEALRPILMIIVAIFSSIISELAYAKIVNKEKNIKNYLAKSYAIFPGLFLALTIPLYTPYYVIAIGAILANIVGKMLFGGFGNNIFNPALIGNLIITMIFGQIIASSGGYLNPLELDAISSSTPLTNFASLGHAGNYETLIAPFGNLNSFFLGLIPGSMGETSALLCLLALIFLAITKTIKTRIPLAYLTTIFLITSIIAFINHFSFWYPFFHLFSGGLMFGAIFMATDPVTSPVTEKGQLLFGVGLGILTIIFRFLTPLPEGVLTAILTMNLINLVIDKFVIKYQIVKYFNYFIQAILVVLVVGVGIYIGNEFKFKPEEKPVSSAKIISEKTLTNEIIYEVSGKGLHEMMLEVVVDKNVKQITQINVKNQSESYWTDITNNDYLNQMIQNQSKLEELDTISGVTFTSKGLKEMIELVINDLNKEDQNAK